MSDDVVGAVLAGGRGRRIGGDKPSLEVGGQSLVLHAVDALRAVGLEVALVLRPQQPVPLTAHTAAVVRDEVQDAGPLGGLHALLRWLPVEWTLVVPCDQPFLAPDLLRGLLAQPKEDADVVIGLVGGRPEPLPGLYRRACLSAVERILAGGQPRLRDLLSTLRVRGVSEEALRRWDPDLRSYVNVNNPAELVRARRLAASAVTEQEKAQRPLSKRR